MMQKRIVFSTHPLDIVETPIQIPLKNQPQKVCSEETAVQLIPRTLRKLLIKKPK
uniref:Uncharacterized protein n=1 Tax=Timema douglasi TaxID=61478 RepID=A0A7R8VYY3_TIMDO|nr:unnamed protein product [Timema douglasi]